MLTYQQNEQQQGSEEQGGNIDSKTQIQTQSQMQLIPDLEYLESRADAIQDVESHIVELGMIFNRLADLVAGQNEMVQRIEDNVDQVSDNVTRAHDVIMNVYKNVTSNRPLLLKGGAVLLLFLIFFIVFMA